MNRLRWISLLYYIGALYDGVLGIAFLLFWARIFDWYGVPPPNHAGYVQFPAALLIIFGLLFLAIARAPVANRNLIPYGILLKVSYCAVIFGHWFTAGIPNMWKPFAVCDFIIMLLFLWTYAVLGREARPATPAAT